MGTDFFYIPMSKRYSSVKYLGARTDTVFLLLNSKGSDMSFTKNVSQTERAKTFNKNTSMSKECCT